MVGLRSEATEEENGIDELVTDLEELMELLHAIQDRWRDVEAGISVFSPRSCLRAEKQYTGMCGRPKYAIKQEQLMFLRELRLTWTTIAAMFGISRRTMYNIRAEFGLVGTEYTAFSDISDEDLKTAVSDIKQIMPDIGQSMLKGVLSSRGIEIPTVRLRECLAELDPINTALRWAGPISRRAYSVPHPNALWHMDGNHKLIRYITSMPLAMSILLWVHWILLYRFLTLLSWTF